MRKILFIILTGIIFASCKGESKANKDAETNENESTTEQTTNKNTMGTIRMTKADFLSKVHNFEKDMETWNYLGDRPAIIDFYADWCGPCKQIAPILEELAKEYGDQIYIYKVNVDDEEELAALFGIRSIPTMLFIPMNGQPQMIAGAAPKSELRKSIESILLNK